MNGIECGQVSVAINILLVLFIFGYFYSQMVERLGHSAEGWSWLLVVGGVAVTEVGIGALELVLGWNALLLGLLGFAASGTPMIFGAVKRYLEERARARKAMTDGG